MRFWLYYFGYIIKLLAKIYKRFIKINTISKIFCLIKDIDYKNKTLHINGTKTNSSNRTIPLFDEAAALLSVLPHNSDGFFFNFRPDYVTHAFKKICPEHKLHDLRHTFATNCPEAEIPLKVVQKWLGHSNIDTTADIYTHVTQDISCAEAHKLTALYNQKNSR